MELINIIGKLNEIKINNKIALYFSYQKLIGVKINKYLYLNNIKARNTYSNTNIENHNYIMSLNKKLEYRYVFLDEIMNTRIVDVLKIDKLLDNEKCNELIKVNEGEV